MESSFRRPLRWNPKKGERVLVRIGNKYAKPPTHFNWRYSTVVAKDGTQLPKSAQYQTNTINVVGETYDIEFAADNPGTWVLHVIYHIMLWD